MKKILLISGSLREKSFNTSLLKHFETKLQGNAEVEWADINLPLFNEELEAEFPPTAEKLRQQILASDLIVIATPEYNRGTSGALKNAIDWASRPWGQNTWQGKSVLVASVSVGAISGALALYQVKQALLHLNAHVIGQPELMVGGASSKFSDTGELIDEATKEHVARAVELVLAHI
jgi:chromate reductase, NAD(P)H dehydrogenase (quinone)